MKLSIPTIITACLVTLQVSAFPQLSPHALQDFLKREAGAKGCPFGHDSTHKKEKRAVSFDPVTQYVSTTGEHAFVPPNLAAGDKRGPCPGLNALANHGYLPHNGIAPMTTIIEAVTQGTSRIYSKAEHTS